MSAEQEEEQYVPEEEVVSIPGWQASVSLDVKDTVETGEEDEEELYCQRSKLFRFKEGEWKERGLGDAKLLKHKETGKVRFMLRQDKTMKIVANHFVIDIAPYCSLSLNTGSDKCWVWSALDCAEGGLKAEQFALKFGNGDLAAKFKEAFDDVKQINTKLGVGASDGSTTAEEAKPVEPSKQEAPPAKVEEKPKAEPTATATQGNGMKDTIAPEQTDANPFAGMSFNLSGCASGGLFGSGTSSATPGLFGAASQSSGGSLFGGAAAATGGGLFSSVGGSLFGGGSSGGGSGATGGGLFGSSPSSGATTGGLFGSAASAGATTGGLFGSAPASGATTGGFFGAAAPAAAAAAPAAAAADSSTKPAAQEEDGEEVADEEVTTIPGWAPTVSLNVLDTVQNGEEDEEELYTQRSKLFRFRDAEWKERGVGLAKLLKHRETGKIRFMLRQEKTEKIVANQYVIKYATYCELRPNQGSEKCWVWTAQDFAEEEAAVEQFALKFGSKELADKFKEAFDSAKDENAKVFTDLPEKKEGDAAPQMQKSPEKKTEEKPPVANGKTEVANPFAGASLFGNMSGSSSLAPAIGGLFASPSSGGAPSSGGGGGLFGSISMGAASGGGLFGGGAAGGGGGGLFGGSTGASTGLFGTSTGNLFGSAPSSGSTLAAASAPAAAAVAGAEGGEGEEENNVEEEVTVIPGWEASVSLDVKDMVETGEEGEEELYSQRSKLYRFRDGEWKERGLGEAKLLKHKETGKVRFMLRQEKTMKIQANHYVVAVPPYCDLQPNAGSEKCWVWLAQDCAEEQASHERLALKFGTTELAQKFKEAFDNAKELNMKVPEFASLAASAGGEAGTAAAATPKAAAPAPTAAKAAAAAPKPSSNGPAPAPAPNPFAGAKLSDSVPEDSSSNAFSGLGGLFGGASGAVSSGGLFGGLATGGLFGGGAASSGSSLFGTPAPVVAASSGSSLFGAPAPAAADSTGGGLFGGGGGLFANGASSIFGSQSGGNGGGGLFGGGTSASGLFGTSTSTGTPGLFGGGAAAAVSSSAAAPDGAKAGDDEELMVEEEVTAIPGWTASVTLEVKDVVETGEEHEQELYSQRSKLLRFRDGEWKERGTGEAKLLKHKDTGKIRFLLRQEKTMKIVANFVVEQAPYCQLMPNAGSAKCWVWSCLDWADGVQAAEQFALKFGSVELAEKFKEAFDAAKMGKAVPKASPKAKPLSSPSLGATSKAAAAAPTTAAATAKASGAQPAWQQWGNNTWQGSGNDYEAYGAEGEEDDTEGYGEYYDGNGYDGENVYENENDTQPAPANGGGASAGAGLAWMAEQQNSAGWRCAGCRLQWKDKDIECGVCEIPRPGYEAQVAEKNAGKPKGAASAASAFLGGGGSTSTPAPAVSGFASGFGGGGLFGGPSSTPTPAAATTPASGGFSFGQPAAPATGTSMFGAPAAAATALSGPATTSIFGTPAPVVVPPKFGFGAAAAAAPVQSTPVVGASVPPPAVATGSWGAVPTATGIFGQPPPPPPAVTPAGQGPLAASSIFAPAAAPPPPAPAAVPATAPAAAVDPTMMAMLAALLQAQTTRSSGGADTEELRRAQEQVRRLEDEAREARRQTDERARRAEQELDEMRRQMQAKQAQATQELQSLEQQRRADRTLLDDFKKEVNEARLAARSAPPPAPAVAASSSTSEATLQGILKVAESALKVAESAQQAVLQLRAEKSSDTMLIAERMDTLEDRLERRFDNWEASLGRQQASARSLPQSAGSRIAHFQALHAEETGRRLQGGQENFGGLTVGMKAREGGSGAGSGGPLLRRNN